MGIRDEFRGIWREMSDPLWLGREEVKDDELLQHFIGVSLAMGLHPTRLFERLIRHQKDSYEALMRMALLFARQGVSEGFLQGYQDAQEAWELREERLGQLSEAIIRFKKQGGDWNDLLPMGRHGKMAPLLED